MFNGTNRIHRFLPMYKSSAMHSVKLRYAKMSRFVLL